MEKMKKQAKEKVLSLNYFKIIKSNLNFFSHFKQLKEVRILLDEIRNHIK